MPARAVVVPQALERLAALRHLAEQYRAFDLVAGKVTPHCEHLACVRLVRTCSTLRRLRPGMACVVT